MKPKEYITQITKADLEELAAVTNLQSGFCINIEKVDGGIRIGLDKAALAQAINGFVRNGGTQETGANSTKVSFDPPS